MPRLLLVLVLVLIAENGGATTTTAPSITGQGSTTMTPGDSSGSNGQGNTTDTVTPSDGSTVSVGPSGTGGGNTTMIGTGGGNTTDSAGGETTTIDAGGATTTMVAEGATTATDATEDVTGGNSTANPVGGETTRIVAEVANTTTGATEDVTGGNSTGNPEGGQTTTMIGGGGIESTTAGVGGNNGTDDDITAPVVVCLDNITQIIDGTSSAIMVSWDEPNATDDSGMATLLSRSHQPGDAFYPGDTLVSYTFVDPAGNTVNCSFDIIITLVDTTPPDVTCPDNLAVTVEKGTSGSNVTWEEPTAFDHSGSATLQSSSHDPGSFFDVGDTMVTYTFVDPAGNTASCSFDILVGAGIKCFRCVGGLNDNDGGDACRYGQEAGVDKEETCDVGEQCGVTRYENYGKFLTMVRKCTSSCSGDNEVDTYACNKTKAPSVMGNVSSQTKCTFCCDEDYCNGKNSASGLFQQAMCFYFFFLVVIMQVFLRY